MLGEVILSLQTWIKLDETIKKSQRKAAMKVVEQFIALLEDYEDVVPPGDNFFCECTYRGHEWRPSLVPGVRYCSHCTAIEDREKVLEIGRR